GNRTAGPPVRGLDRYAYDIRKGHVVIVGYFSVGEGTGTGEGAGITKEQETSPRVRGGGLGERFYSFVPARWWGRPTAGRGSRARSSTRSTGSRSARASSGESSISSSARFPATSTGSRRSGRRR